MNIAASRGQEWSAVLNSDSEDFESAMDRYSSEKNREVCLTTSVVF